METNETLDIATKAIKFNLYIVLVLLLHTQASPNALNINDPKSKQGFCAEYYPL